MSIFCTSLRVKNIGRELFPGPGFLQDGDVVEIIGEQSTGKSTILQDLMITCLLPEDHDGCMSGVIYFDLDYHFDLLRVVAIIEQRTQGTENDIQNWLKNFHLIRCADMEQLVISLHAIEPLIANSKIPVGMIILDSISALHWVDSNAGNNSQYLKEAKLRKIVQVLQALKERYKLCILASTQQLLKKDCRQNRDDEEEVVPYKPFLCRQWLEFVKHRFVVTKDDHEEVTTRKILCLSSKMDTKQFVIDEKGFHLVKA
ncbi:DNA repair protein XRCC2-like [Clavelina lepadiformis]|uniref:RecA family profile 1 domain-containing protein n=1 Tax=Clavelina lepadiformis TaxID=159417 RepID=A0ABP0G7T0_CLALP